ncbi:NAD-dependent epimerase/dehydratase family protein [Chitinophaga pinensis]|uniref:NAD-dependent epimerase/dehydratase family protein n=1 Tax=Chitinophaga pinensis TaxID=79329 RepID=A0A5C6LNR2_9BACT|nr:NAD-dependent epimerase/dehydratase family protein [Chitinophaga pinensis]TWV91487.1 NAD-dependent epimerase/dehydratase family protein [Chitinophaga pinensis]
MFAPLLLTTLLLSVLKKSKSARVVTVSSASHAMEGKPAINDIELTQNYSMSKAYAFSKLYVIWIMRRLVTEVPKQGISNITFNTVHPGSTQTSPGREAVKSLKWKIIYFLWRPMMISIEKAAGSSILAAVSPGLQGVTGNILALKVKKKRTINTIRQRMKRQSGIIVSR